MNSSTLAIIIAFCLGRSYGFSFFCPVAGFTVNPRLRCLKQLNKQRYQSLVILRDVPQDTLSDTITNGSISFDNIVLNGIHGDTKQKSSAGNVEIGSSSVTTNGSNGVNVGATDVTANQESNIDVPMPTKNGGFSHTEKSRAKISKANKGKVPWNKGRVRSAEEKARISAGVKARLREQHLEKLEKLGITEEEWEVEQHKIKAEKERIKAEKQKRRTAKGGYTPTEETKRKISEKIKAKWAAGEVKPRPSKKLDPNWVHPRAGIGHTEETKEKIRQTLKARWKVRMTCFKD